MKGHILNLMFAMIVIPLWVSAQIRMDPRALGLAGANATVSRGIHSVGWNPANLGFYGENSPTTMISLGNINFKAENSSISITDLNKFSGIDLEEIDPYTNKPYKDEFLSLFPESGWNIYSHLTFNTPLLNISHKNLAYTNDIIAISDVSLPRSVIDILFQGNEINRNYDMTLGVEVLAIMAHRFSIGLPNEYGSFGMTLSYLQGMTYIGLDPDSSESYFITDTSLVSAHAEYLSRGTIGGNGVGLDLGYTTRENNGWQFSVAVNNLFANIEWNKPTYTYKLLNNVLGITDRDRALYRRHWYDIEELRPTDFLNTSGGSDTTQTPEIISSGDSLIEASDKPFNVKYPAIFRIGVMRRLNDEVTLLMDLRTGFEDRFFATPTWKYSMGLEIVRTPAFPIRVGAAFGANGYRMMAFGFAVRKSIFSIDFGMAFDGGFTANTAKGLELSLGGQIRI